MRINLTRMQYLPFLLLLAILSFGCTPERKSRQRIESLQASAGSQKYELGIACMQYITKDGADISYARSLIRTLLDLEFYAEAIHGVDWLLRRYPNDGELFYLRSLGHRKQHQYDLAFDDIRRARELQSQGGDLAREYAEIVEEQRRWAGIDSLSRTLASASDSFAILIQRADYFFEIREFDAVLFDLGAASGMRTPEDSAYYAQKVSSLYKDSGRPVESLSEMLEYFKKVEE